MWRYGLVSRNFLAVGLRMQLAQAGYGYLCLSEIIFKGP